MTENSRPWIITDPTGEWLFATFPTEKQRDDRSAERKVPRRR